MTAPKRIKIYEEEFEEKHEPFVSLFIGEKPRLPLIDDTVVEIVDPTVGEPTAPPAGFVDVDGVRVRLVEPKEEEVDWTDEMEVDLAQQGMDPTDSMDDGSSRTTNQTLKDLLTQSMAEATDMMGKAKRIKAGSEKVTTVYEVLDDDDEVDKDDNGNDKDNDGNVIKPKSNQSLFTPKFIKYHIKCDLCHLKSDHPLAHFWFHFNEQPRYQCPECPATAGKIEDAVIHMRAVHKSFVDGPIDRINALRTALWDYQIHQCFPNNFKLEPQSTMPARLHEMVDCRCGAILDKEDPILFNHIVRFHADEAIDYDDPEGMKNRYYFDDPDGSRMERTMERRARYLLEEQLLKEKEAEKVRQQKRRKADSDSEESDEDEEGEESEVEDEEDDNEVDEDGDEEELEEDEVEDEEEDDGLGF